MTPLDRALQLRDIVLELVKNAEPVRVAGKDQALAAWERKIGRLRLVYYPASEAHPFYGVNIWLHDPKARGKVLNIEWLDNRVELRAFKRGDWERELEAHAQRQLQGSRAGRPLRFKHSLNTRGRAPAPAARWLLRLLHRAVKTPLRCLRVPFRGRGEARNAL
jgi:hypothetical protein